MMTFLKRFIYFGYYLKKLDATKFFKQMNKASQVSSLSKFQLFTDLIHSSFKYNISILEYFYFHFYENKSEVFRSSFAGTGFMYETISSMNLREARMVLSDKLIFLKKYNLFINHQYENIDNLEKDLNLAKKLLENKSKKIVLKNSNGQCGQGIEIRFCSDFTPATLIQRLRETHNDFAEEFVTQHKDLMRLSPSGLNTVRIITQLDNHDNVDILGARLRITINSSIDNLAAGNIAAPIDLETGKIYGPGVYSDITKEDELIHPITFTKIVDFQIPFWKESIEMVKKAALVDTRNRSIGWDVAITEKGPELIEGNHNWCKLLWQLPVKKGLKAELEKYL